MSIAWDLIHAAASYAKVIEYAIVIGALVASLYAKNRISLASKQIRESVHASAEELRQGVVGMVDVVDCVTSPSSPWFAGPYGLVLANPRKQQNIESLWRAIRSDA